MTKTLRVLVVDDEPLARQRLTDLIDAASEARLVGTASTGREAVAAIREHAPDLVFLDVQMPGFSGLDVVRTIGPEAMPATVFVTAYDQHALEAFDLAALDYLLKPFDDERFEQALRRALNHVRLRDLGALQERLERLLDAQAGQASDSEPPLERIAVEMRGQVRIVPVEQVDYITADGPYAELHAGENTYVIREQMQTLEERLDPTRFYRIHRSTIVQLDRIETLLVGAGGEYAVRLRTGERLRVSRGRYEALTEQLGML